MEEAVKSVDLRSKVLSGTLSGNGIVSMLAHAHAQHEAEVKARSLTDGAGADGEVAAAAAAPGLSGGTTEWGDLLDRFFVASKQLDEVHSALTPMFALTIPTPRRVPLPPTEPFPVPQLLSTALAPEDADKIKIPPKGGAATTELKETIAKHNAGIEGCITKFNVQIESWKKARSGGGGVKRSREGL